MQSQLRPAFGTHLFDAELAAAVFGAHLFDAELPAVVFGAHLCDTGPVAAVFGDHLWMQAQLLPAKRTGFSLHVQISQFLHGASFEACRLEPGFLLTHILRRVRVCVGLGSD